MKMKLMSWNVNGLRAGIRNGFIDSMKKENPDILCLQETKVNEVQDIGLGYMMYWNYADKKGYSGTAVFTKIKPLNVTYGMGKHEGEGRIITLEFEKFFLITVYTPNSKRGILRLDNRKEWDADFLNYMKSLEKKKPVVVCGDLNVAHTEIDLANPKSNYNKTPGYTQVEIDDFNNILNAGFIDTFRLLHKDEIKYSWWSYMFNARAKNVGWRIDYFLVSSSLKKNIEDAFIKNEITGSDHCPVGIVLNL